MTPQQAHRLRCETCKYNYRSKEHKCPYDHADRYYSLKEVMRLPKGAWLFTSIVGCASHSAASPHPAPEQNTGELEYGTVSRDGVDWRLRRFDAGMGETEYRIFRNETFFAQFDNRDNADDVMEFVTGRCYRI